MTVHGVGQRDLGLALGERREAREQLALARQPRREVRDIASRVVGLDLDLPLGDRHRPDQVGSEPADMGQAVILRDRLDGAAHQGGRRPRVLVARIPGAAG